MNQPWSHKRNNSDVNLAVKEGYDSTKSQINGWGLKYDKLFFGKPVYDVFVDDKNFEFKIRTNYL